MNKKISIIIIILIVLSIAIFIFTKNDTQDKDDASINTNTSNEVQNGYNLENTNTVGEVILGQTFTPEEVAMHNSENDCYTTINGIVYDLTAWIDKHPGGDKNILRLCGIDGTSAFQGQHGDNQKAINTLAGFEIGTLAN